MKTLKEHQQITKEVLEILRANKLYIKLEKCEIEKEKIEYLGVVVFEGRVEVDPIPNRGLDKLANAKEVERTPKFPWVL